MSESDAVAPTTETHIPLRCNLSVTKVFRFAAHHRLPRHSGKCARDHGHNYRVEVTASGALICDASRSDDGMVIDFGDLKSLVAPLIDERLDHYSLNDTLENPTAEQLACWLLAQLPPLVTRIVVWETDDSFATAERVQPMTQRTQRARRSRARE